jgi:hypothetical protein
MTSFLPLSWNKVRGPEDLHTSVYPSSCRLLSH